MSEGRNVQTIDACARAIEGAGARLAHVTSDVHHHRSVFTFFGDAATIERAVAALATVCVERIDLRAHAGVHPRIGALDVVPVVPMQGASLADAAEVARAAARAMWTAAGLPSIFYGAAATVPSRAQLADVRRGDFEGLAAREAAGERPDMGDRLFHPSAGTAAVGARDVLIALNLELAGVSLEAARAIARTLRERSGGLRTLRALGLAAGDTIQLSFNLTGAQAVPLDRLAALAARAAARYGGRVTAMELIGLIPRDAVARAVERMLQS